MCHSREPTSRVLWPRGNGHPGMHRGQPMPANHLSAGMRTRPSPVAGYMPLCYNRLVDHERWMREAVVEAKKALTHGDVPIGAVAVVKDVVIARGHNRKEADQDPTAHAEIIAIRRAARALGRWRLDDLTLYCTLEPCPMCAGAMVLARIGRVVYGVDDPKAGAAGSVVELLRDPRFNHQVAVTRGILSDQAKALLERFFSRLRQED